MRDLATVVVGIVFGILLAGFSVNRLSGQLSPAIESPQISMQTISRAASSPDIWQVPQDLTDTRAMTDWANWCVSRLRLTLAMAQWVTGDAARVITADGVAGAPITASHQPPDISGADKSVFCSI